MLLYILTELQFGEEVSLFKLFGERSITVFQCLTDIHFYNTLRHKNDL